VPDLEIVTLRFNYLSIHAFKNVYVINTYQENQTLKKQIKQKELEEQKARAERRMEKLRYLTDQIIITNALRGEDDTETAKYILLNNYKEKIESIEAGLDEDRDEIICRYKGRPV